VRHDICNSQNVLTFPSVRISGSHFKIIQISVMFLALSCLSVAGRLQIILHPVVLFRLLFG
jgi:hypothetical protein